MKKFIIYIIIFSCFNSIIHEGVKSQVMELDLYQSEGCRTQSLANVGGENCNDFEHGEWVLIFEDRFDGESINTDIWHTCIDGWNREHGEEEFQYYKDENIVVDNGELHLVAREDPGMYPVWRFEGDGTPYQEDKFFQYSSGWIQTKAKYKYGLFEVKCKIPKGRGLWPAFWLYGNTYELDIFEFAGEKPQECNFNAHKWSNSGSINCPSDITNENPFSDDYHVYSVEWDELKMVYRIDGQEVLKVFRYHDRLGRTFTDCHHLTNANWVFDLVRFPRRPMSVILNLAISDGHYCGPPNHETFFPSSLDVDYIRIYKRNSPNRIVTVNNDIDSDVNCFLGGNIFVGGGESPFRIPEQNSLKVVACNEVIITSETDFSYGAEVDIYIVQDSPRSDAAISDLNQDEDLVFAATESEYMTLDSKVKISPNPGNGPYWVQFSDGWETMEKLIIWNSVGSKMYELKVGDSQEYVLGINLHSGVYTMIVEGKGETVSKKIIVP